MLRDLTSPDTKSESVGTHNIFSLKLAKVGKNIERLYRQEMGAVTFKVSL